MYKRKWPNIILSSEGFEVEIGSRGFLVYREGSKKMKVISEYLATKEVCIAIWKNAEYKWETPYEKENINDEEKQIILKRIEEALKFRNIKVEIY